MSTLVTDPFVFLRLVEPLTGTWSGTGHSGCPTIGDFDYREALELAVRPAEETLCYEQQTWRLKELGALPSHWEVGSTSAWSRPRGPSGSRRRRSNTSSAWPRPWVEEETLHLRNRLVRED